MTFTVTIETDNDAFVPDPAAEVARLLRRLALTLDLDGRDDSGKLLDVNGNTVGRWTVRS